MHNPKGKTKNAMLLELESIKGLLVEEDIPVLQEVVIQDIPLLDTIVPPEDLPEEAIPLLNLVVQEEDLSVQSSALTTPWDEPVPEAAHGATDIEEDASALSFNTLDIGEALGASEALEDTSEALKDISELAGANEIVDTAAADSQPLKHREEQQQDFFQLIADPEPQASSESPSSRPAAKPAGENPFLPQHIRARLQGNNSPPSISLEDLEESINKRFQNLSLGSSPSHTAKKPSSIQQQLINDIMDKMLPEMAKELRGRLEKMNKQMLEALLAER